MEQKTLKLTKEMLETEKQLTTELQKMNILGSAINSMQDSQAKTEKAAVELEKLPETSKIYKPVGRMFVMVKKPEILEEFAKNVKTFQEDIQENQKLMDQCKEKAEGIRKSLSDMIKGGVRAGQ